jgi:ubiquinone/menaquinone biosynthesis C-methylase UbiE
LLRPLAVLAMYRPLHAVGGADRLAARRLGPPALTQLLQRSVQDVLTERALRQGISVIGAITDEVSRAVRGMYEEHPYPRWFFLDRLPPLALVDWLSRQVPIEHAPIEVPAAPRILVAGCGTGMEAIWLATDIAGAQVLGVDLSLSSLAYARRKAGELNVTNIEFRHGNILELGVMSERFDMIYCSGVLHHLLDPEAGLRVLLQLLQPGGLLKIGLYSARARASVNAARDMIRAQQLPATETSIRAFRQQIFGSAQDSPARPLLKFRDFYAMSTCRDLLFHVQEHQFSLPQVAAMLHDHGLVVLGLSDILPHAVNAYRQMFPGDDGMKNLANWDAFEALHPETFVAMYHVWCCLPRGATQNRSQK